MKTIDTRAYINMLRELTESGKEVTLVVAGSSMAPFLIHHRDSICFRKPDRDLRKGDMVFFQQTDGAYVMHRICRIRDNAYYLIGDAQTEVEGPIRREQIFALITKIKRKGKWICPGNFWWFFFARVWIRVIPFRRLFIRLYGIKGLFRQ